jgi:IS605 OrfB family transposase
MRVFRTEQIWLKQTEHLRKLCHISKNLFNEANYLVRQAFFNEKKWIRLSQLHLELLSSVNFQQLPIPTARKVLQLVDKAWKSFFAASIDWKCHPVKYFQQPRIPKYKPKNGQFQVAFEKNQVIFSNGVLMLPQITGIQIKPRFASPTSLIGVRIIPRGVGYVLEIIYSKYIPRVTNYPPKHITGIDIGLTNLVTMVNNIGEKPIVINSGVVKSINHYYNKERARLQSVYARQGIEIGKKMKKLVDKRNKKIVSYFHEASRNVINWCKKNNIDTIVIGRNKYWKHQINLGKRINQNFVSVPFYRLIQMIQYKAQDVGIHVLLSREEYTSKSSFLDGEPITKQSKYVGERISRGLYCSKNGILINSDVNGAYNIIKKAVPNAFSQWETTDGIKGVWLHPVKLKAIRQPLAC